MGNGDRRCGEMPIGIHQASEKIAQKRDGEQWPSQSTCHGSLRELQKSEMGEALRP